MRPRRAKATPDISSEGAGPAQIIRTKIQPPPLRGSTLSRQRLLDRLNAATEQRVTLIVAEAGYGKTTLLTDFSSRSPIRCLWYKLDPTDGDHVTMVSYLVGGIREVESGFGTETLRLLGQQATDRASGERILACLLSELQDLSDTPTALILDDFHTVDDSAQALDVLSRLVRDAPPSLRFIISTRRRPPVPLARLAGMGELAEFTTDDLRFSREETHRLFADSYGQPLDPDVLEQLDLRTEGWGASLQLLYSSIRGRPASAVRSLARALSGASGPVYDFLAEEVIGHLRPELERFLVRTALLDRIMADRVAALFADVPTPPSIDQAGAWISEADNLGLLSRGSQTSETRQLHPLLREFLLRQLADRSTADEIQQMHARVARATEATEPLVACHHYIAAGQADEAMRCLGANVMLTMGSGRWGAASRLIDRLSAVPAEPALLAIQARRLFEEGDTAGAATLLGSTDLADQPAAVRAVLRQTRISMGWRSGDSGSLSETLEEVGEDTETPELLREIAQIFIDSSPRSPSPAPFPDLAKRLERMAEAQAAAGHHYYSAISLHNAAIALVTSGRFIEALELGERALETFQAVKSGVTAPYSTHAVMAAAALELGDRIRGDEEIRLATSTGEQDGDVDAACAFYLAATGQREEAARLLLNADRLQRAGRSDISGWMFAGFADALLRQPMQPEVSLEILQNLPSEVPLDLELHLQHRTLTATAQLLSGHTEDAGQTSAESLTSAKQRCGRRFEVRLALISALAQQDPPAVVTALKEAAALSELAVLELADALGQALYLMPLIPPELSASIAAWPARWLPVLRRQLEYGDTPAAHAAAALLDQHGEFEDIGRLRAYEKTYRRRSRKGLGRALARRVSPKLEIHDLGRVSLRIADRHVRVSTIRRKPASLLMYLITRPRYTATREQVLDEIWPETDPTAAANSLNQSLYFLRREIDPWYEDDVSADYICYEGEILWIDTQLTGIASGQFVADARDLLLRDFTPAEALQLVQSYTGPFSPEFEYEEWAIAWRSRVHASYLNFANAAIDRLVRQGELAAAVDVAERVLAVDPAAGDMERKLVWLYWHTGATSAAVAQHKHLVADHVADGLDPPGLASLTSGPAP